MLRAKPFVVSVYDISRAVIVFTAEFAPGSTVCIGADPSSDVVVDRNYGIQRHELIVRGDSINLDPQMRLHMCGEHGEDRVRGSYDELVASGIAMPIAACSRVNVTLRSGSLAVFMKYVDP